MTDLDSKLRSLVVNHGGSDEYDMRDLALLTRAAADLALEAAAEMCQANADALYREYGDGPQGNTWYCAADDIRAMKVTK